MQGSRSDDRWDGLSKAILDICLRKEDIVQGGWCTSRLYIAISSNISIAGEVRNNSNAKWRKHLKSTCWISASMGLLNGEKNNKVSDVSERNRKNSSMLGAKTNFSWLTIPLKVLHNFASTLMIAIGAEILKGCRQVSCDKTQWYLWFLSVLQSWKEKNIPAEILCRTQNSLDCYEF